LRDDLCLYLPVPEKTSDFLQTTVEACLREIIKTMSGQYIAHNEENDQYYLDLKKDVDYDAKIEERAESLSNSELDRYYFDALTRVMECADQTYVSGYRIWEHEVEWREHKVTRRGYLFFGAPNERSTAQPPRDFYIYFIQPFEMPRFKDEKLADEVFFTLKQRDEEFMRALRLYAGAREMATQASSGTRKVYEDKATVHLTKLTAWLRQHMLAAYEVAHQGVPKKMVECLKGQKTGNATVRELVNLVGSTCLAACFAERYPDYPKFSVTLTTSNLGMAVEDAIRCLAGGLKTNVATAIIDGLELMEAEKIRPHGSRYAKAVLKKLEAKGAGQVVNRKELITAENGVELDAAYKVEPELLVVVLLAMVHSGDITMSLVGRKLDAANLSEAPRIPVEELCRFKHIERPKDIAIGPLVALFELLGLPEGLIRNPETREEAITQLQAKVAEVTQRVVLTKQNVQTGVPCWGGELIASEDRQKHTQRLDGLQGFLERLQAFNTPGKLKNFPYSADEVKAQGKNLSLVDEMASLSDLAIELTPITSYLTTATALLPPLDPWCGQAEETRSEWRTQLLDPAARSAADFRQRILAALETVRKAYQDYYFGLHQKARLNVTEDEKKRNLMRDSRLERLKKLTGVALLPHANLTDLQNRLAALKPCYTLIKDDLAATPLCPHCSFRPSEEAGGPSGSVVLGQIDEQIDGMIDNWTKTVLDNLSDPTAEQSIDLLESGQKQAVKKFMKAKELPEKISNDLVQGVQNALSGLVPIPVTPTALIEALGEGNTPCTVEQFRSRFDDFVQQITRGKDVSKVRIMIEKGRQPSQKQ
jgi:hypothetical protein